MTLCKYVENTNVKFFLGNQYFTFGVHPWDSSFTDFTCSANISYVCTVTGQEGVLCSSEWQLIHEACVASTTSKQTKCRQRAVCTFSNSCKKKHITAKLCALCWWSWLVTMTAERRPCIYLVPSYKLADTHTYSQTQWRRSCHARPWPAQREQFGYQRLTQGHFIMQSGDNRQSTLIAGGPAPPSELLSLTHKQQADCGDTQYGCWMSSVKKNVTLYWKTVFFMHCFCFLFFRHCGYSLTAEKHSSWHKLTDGALLPGWTVFSQRCRIQVFYFESSATANQLTQASTILCIDTSRLCPVTHKSSLFLAVNDLSK